MTFLNSAMLAGLFAVGAPLAIHLLSRPRFRDLRWAAMQFLLPSLKKSRRISRVEDILLLLLRGVLVALLVLIFARPARLVDPAELAKSADAATRVVILDQSASMGHNDGLRTRFEVAKAEADNWIAAQAPDSANALFLATDRVRRVVAHPTSDLANVRAALASASLTDAGSDLFPAIKAAIDVLKKAPAGRREIVIFTDNQATAWRQLVPLRALLTDSPGITLDVHVVGETRGTNLALVSVQPQAVVAVAIDQPVRFSIEVANRGNAVATRIPVKLAVDADAPLAETVVDRLDPGASRTVTLTARFSTPGPHSVTASLPPDPLPFDNQRSFALRVLPQLRALVVDEPVPAGLVRSGFFLSRALVPVRPEEAGRHFVKATLANPAELAQPTLDGYPLVFLSNLIRLTSTQAQNLRRHVDAGATLVVFPGPATDLSFFNRDPDFSALMPARLDAARLPATQTKTLAWQSHDYTHPLTAIWNDPASGHLGSVSVSSYFPILANDDALDASGTQVVVRYGNGEPAAIERATGRGRVILFSSAAFPGPTTLPLHPAFVPLILRIAAHASGAIDDGINLPPGQTFSSPVDADAANASVFVQRPGDTTRRDAGQVEESATHAAALRYDDTEQAGVYRLFVGNEARPRALFAVQSDPAESDPATLPANDLAALTAPPSPAAATAVKATPPATPPAIPATRVPGPELWAAFALAALVVALLETALAHYFSRIKA
jgi:hypothetical protein